MTKMQHCIPHFILDKYHPSYSELVSVQKLLSFELKILGNEVVHTIEPKKKSHVIIDAYIP